MSVFLQILHQSSVLSNITPLYFFISKVIYFVQKESIKVQMFETFEWVNIRQVPHFNFETTINSPSNFASFFILMTHNFSVNFKLIYFLLWVKESHQGSDTAIFLMSFLKIFHIPHIIFQTTSQFFCKFCITQFSKCLFCCSFCAKYITFDLKKYRGVISHYTEKYCQV